MTGDQTADPAPAAGQLDADTQVVPDGPGRYSGTISPAWNIGENPNGGYLLASLLAAIEAETGLDRALSVTAHYLKPGLSEQPATFEVDVVRRGRTATTVRATLIQDGRARVVMLAAMTSSANQSRGAGEHAVTVPPLDLPPPEQCVDRKELVQGVDLPLLSRVEVRVHPDDAAPPPEGSELRRARVRGWIRLTDQRPPDARALVLFADAFPPSVFTRFGSVGWVPTLELTVHVRANPAPGWIRASLEVDDLGDDLMIETGSLWDSSGTLVARMRQLGMLLIDR